jgi:hypothetical protein
MKRAVLSLFLPLIMISHSDARNSHSPIEFANSKHVLKKNISARVYFSNEIPVAGIAKEDKLFYINPDKGGFLYVIVDNYPTPIRYNKIKLYMYKTMDETPVRFDERVYDIDGSFTYTYIKYTFYTTGNFIIDVFGSDGEFIGSGKVEIRKSDASSGTSNTPVYGPRVYFSTQTPIAGIATDVKAFQLQPGGGYVYVVVDNYPNNFNVRSLRVNVYKWDDGAYRREDKLSYKIDGDLYFTYFKYTFRKVGDYRFDVYDGKDKFINTGYVTISW